MITNEEHVSRETLDDDSDMEATGTTESSEESTDTEQPAAKETEETDSSDNEIKAVRREAANYRTKLRERETELESMKSELFAAKVSASGLFADPTDMPVNLDLVSDDEALTAAMEALLESKPHLRARQFGNIGQGERGTAQGVSLGSILRNNA